MTPHEHQDIETLSAYLDGEMNAAEMTRVEDHLSACEECTDRRESLRSAALAVSTLESVAPSPNESREIRQAVLQAAARKPSIWITPARLAGALGAVVLLGAGVLGLSIMNDESGGRTSPGAGREAASDAAFDPVTEHNFNTPQEILAVVEADPAVVEGASMYEVADVGQRQLSELERTTVAGEEAEAGMSQPGDEGAVTPVHTPLWGCQRKVLQSKPYPTMPITARPAVYQGEKAWMLIFAFSYSQEETEALDRIRVQLVRRTDCHLLVEQVFKP